MKGFGKLLVVCGLILAALGLVGFITISQSGYSGDFMDMGIGLGNMLGVSSSMTMGERFLWYLMQYRKTMFIGGLIAGVAGIFLNKYMSN